MKRHDTWEKRSNNTKNYRATKHNTALQLSIMWPNHHNRDTTQQGPLDYNKFIFVLIKLFLGRNDCPYKAFL